MNCFQHPQTAAVGFCRHCARGLCHECAYDEGFGLACKDRCEADVRSLHQIVERNKQIVEKSTRIAEKNKSILAKTTAVYLRSMLLYGLMGLFLVLFPYFFPNTPAELRYLFLGMGTLCLLGAVFNLLNARRFKKT